MKRRAVSCICVVVFLLTGAYANGEKISQAKKFISLFDGKTLNGWVTVGTPGSFEVRDGAIYTTGKKPFPSWLRTEKQYENFILRFSYKTGGWYEGGVLIHAPLYGPGSKIGFKLHLRHDHKPYGVRSPGAIYDVAAPLAFPGKGPKQWNQCEILYDWPLLRIKMNGRLIHDIDMSKVPAFKHRLRRGYIGIQNICEGGAYFKDIEICPLPDSEEKWIDLFAEGSKALRFTGGAKWSVKDGTLVGKGRGGMAYTLQSFEAPYELDVWCKTITDGNGGVMFNCGNQNVEVQCFNVPDTTNPTGSLYGISPARRLVSRDNEWFLMQIFNEGKHAEVYVNGEKVSETNSLKPPFKGTIGFQQHTPNGLIFYRAKLKKLSKASK